MSTSQYFASIGFSSLVAAAVLYRQLESAALTTYRVAATAAHLGYTALTSEQAKQVYRAILHAVWIAMVYSFHAVRMTRMAMDAYVDRCLESEQTELEPALPEVELQLEQPIDVTEGAEVTEEDPHLTELILDGFEKLDAQKEESSALFPIAEPDVLGEFVEFDIKAHVKQQYGGLRQLRVFARGKVPGFARMGVEQLWDELLKGGFVEQP